MGMRLPLLPLIAAVLCSTSMLLAAEIPHVFDPGTPPDDQRLKVLHDVDHPVIFAPDSFDMTKWEARANALRQQVLVAEGLWPMPQKTPLNIVIHGKIDRDAYTIEKVFFASYPGHYVSGNLYRPKDHPGKLPAVLCPHGHWTNGRLYERSDKEAQKQIDEGAEMTMEGAKYPLQARCAMLARMGCIVFMYDMVGYADSTAIEHRTGFTDTESILRLQSFMGLQTWNSIRVMDFITSLPDVDPSRIAVTGASGGGTQTIFISAVDDRVAAAFPAVMVSEAMQGGCICENAPLLRVGTNNVELIATFAPKPLGMSAANDWTVALETDGLPKIQAIYQLFGAKENAIGKHFSFEHNYNQWSRELMYNTFNKALNLGWPAPVKEHPWTPVAPKELSVYDADHPRPADTADAKSLRKYMTESSDKQLANLFHDHPDEYQKDVTAALRVMVSDQLPTADEVTVSRSSGPQEQDGYVLETGALSRRGCGEAVPFASLVPTKWNGAVVVWANPQGFSSLFSTDGQPSSDAQGILRRNTAIICADLYLTGEFGQVAAAQNHGYEKQKYAGFQYAYNRGILANQVHDLLSEIAYAKGWKGTAEIGLVGCAKSGVPAYLATAIAGDAIRRSAIDLDQFDFDQVTDGLDAKMLPGALKYGGIRGFAALCSGHSMFLSGIHVEKSDDRCAGIQIMADSAPTAKLIDWALAAP